jgi:membrane protein required for beta-lactamase induction
LTAIISIFLIISLILFILKTGLHDQRVKRNGEWKDDVTDDIKQLYKFSWIGSLVFFVLALILVFL